MTAGRKRRRRRGILAVLLGVCLVFGMVGPFVVQALWNSDRAVHVNGAEIENSTLIIGTHLIHISALTDDLYDIAKASADDSMQQKRYYKSELASGTWFDITSADTLEDISTAGKPVTVDEINGLFLEYHTKSDGITYDLRTGEPVNIFDIRNPYDLESMEELQPVKLQFDRLNEMESPEDADETCQDLMEDLFKTEIKKAEVSVTDEDTGETEVYSGKMTEDADKNMEALNKYLAILNENGGGPDEKNEVTGVMSSVDAWRRLIVYEIVYDKTYEMMTKMTDVQGVSSELTDAANEAVSNLTSAIIEQEGNMIEEGETVISWEIYRWTNSLIENAAGDDMASCDTAVANLLGLKNITDGTVGNGPLELGILENGMLAKAGTRYVDGISAGENSEYLTARAGRAAQVMLNTIASEYISKVNTYRNELEFLVDAKCTRINNQEAQDYIRQCITEASSYYGAIKNDGFYGNCKTSLDEYVKWLNDKLNSLIKGGGGTEADALAVQKSELETEYMAALDKNDLEKAKEVEALIAEVDGQIQAMETALASQFQEIQTEMQEIQKKIDQLDSADAAGRSELESALALKQAEAEAVKSEMSEGSVGRMTAEMKAEALNAVTGSPDSETLNSLADTVDSLGELLEMNYKTAFPALKEVYSKMVRARDVDGSEAYDEIIAQVEELILNNKSAYDAAMAAEVSADALSEAADAVFGGEEMDQWSDEEMGAYLAAGQMYLETLAGGGNGNKEGGSGIGNGTEGSGSGVGTGTGAGESGTAGDGSGAGTGTGGSGTAGGGSGAGTGTGGSGTAGGGSGAGAGTGAGGSGTTGGGSGAGTGMGTGGSGTAGGGSGAGAGIGTGGSGTGGSGTGGSGTGGSGTAGGESGAGAGTETGGSGTTGGGSGAGSETGGSGTAGAGNGAETGTGGSGTAGGGSGAGAGSETGGSGTTEGGSGAGAGTETGGSGTTGGGSGAGAGSGTGGSGTTEGGSGAGAGTETGGSGTTGDGSGAGTETGGGGTTGGGAGAGSGTGGSGTTGGGSGAGAGTGGNGTTGDGSGAGAGTETGGSGTTGGGSGVGTETGGSGTAEGGAGTTGGTGTTEGTKTSESETKSGTPEPPAGETKASTQPGTGAGTAESGTAESGTAESGTAESGIAESGTAKSGTSKSNTAESAQKAIRQQLEAAAANAYLSGNPYVYLRINDPSLRYIPLPLIGTYTKMRYVWNMPKNKATLAAGSRYYEFTLFSDQVRVGRADSDIKTLKNAPKLKSVIHIPEAFAEEEFGCSAVYIQNSQYGMLYTPEMQEQAEELLAAMMEGGG